jgi:hypothetical protein
MSFALCLEADLISHIKATYKLYNKTNINFLAGEYDVNVQYIHNM